MSSEYTAFPGEDEVLIQDGLEYTIKDIFQTNHEKLSVPITII